MPSLKNIYRNYCLKKKQKKKNPMVKWSPPSTFGVSSITESCPTLCPPWTAACQASLSITKSWSLLKLISIKSVIPSNHLILCRPLLLLPSIFPSIRVLSVLSPLLLQPRLELWNLTERGDTEEGTPFPSGLVAWPSFTSQVHPHKGHWFSWE